MRKQRRNTHVQAMPDARKIARPARRDDVAFHQLDDEGLIHDTVSGNTHWLNGTALFIWQRCDGGHNVHDIAQLMSTVYDVSMSAALGHVERLLEELKARNLVHTSFEWKGSDESS